MGTRTHGITRRTVETLVKAKKRGDVVYFERRGNKIKNRTYSPDDEKAIIDHVNSFPKVQSHYTSLKMTENILAKI